MSTTSLRGLPKRLVASGVLEAGHAQEIVDTCVKSKSSFVKHIVDEDILTANQVASLSSEEFGIPLYDIDAHNLAMAPKDILDHSLIAKHEALPLIKRQNRLYVAVSDPTNQYALTEIRFQAGCQVEAVLVEHDKLMTAIENYFNSQEESLNDALGDFDDATLDGLDIDRGQPEEDSDSDPENDAPIVKYVNKILLDAIKKGASDIHFEPYEKSYRVRYRIDGILTKVNSPPPSLSTRLAARLKVMSQMDISERRLPQDGRIKLKVTKSKSIDFRVNTLPTLFGEKVVLRILDASQAKMGIDALGYDEDQKEGYLDALSQSQGMILVTGPTGSGKTVSLYTGLGILNTPETNISTAEDPVEINMEGVNQVHINNKTGFTFAEALRAFLRQDPDVIMVGEIRDLETAEIAIKAAQTGHLVLSTLHTNSAPETLTRLMNMGVPAFNVATSVSIIIAQRLARRLCKHCKEPHSDIPTNIFQQEGFVDSGINIENITLFKPVGCKQCTKGYKGRTGIYELLKVTPAVSRIIMEGGNSLNIADQAKQEGFRTLRQSALRKAAEGIISLEEANRITKD